MVEEAVTYATSILGTRTLPAGEPEPQYGEALIRGVHDASYLGTLQGDRVLIPEVPRGDGAWPAVRTANSTTWRLRAPAGMYGLGGQGGQFRIVAGEGRIFDYHGPVVGTDPATGGFQTPAMFRVADTYQPDVTTTSDTAIRVLTATILIGGVVWVAVERDKIRRYLETGRWQ